METATEAVLVVGGTGALGGVVVPALAKAGYRVLVYARRPVAGERYEHPQVSVHEGDLADDWFCWRLVNALEDEGVRFLRGAVFINGSFARDRGIAASHFTQYLTQLYEANLFPITRLLEVLGPYWRDRPGGRVVLTSAAAATRPFPKGGAYALAKRAVADVGRQLNLEFQPEELQTLVLAPRIIGARIGQNAPAELTGQILGFLARE